MPAQWKLYSTEIIEDLNNVLVHIGYHQTGSWWLQDKLFVSGHLVFEDFSMHYQRQSSLARHFIYTRDKDMLSPFDFNLDQIQKEAQKLRSTRNGAPAGKIWVMSQG